MGWGKVKRDFIKRYWYMPIIVPILIYYGFIYWWLFYDQFYRILIQSDATWQLEYRMPVRTKTIPVNDISTIQAVTGDMRTYEMTRILIFTRDGNRYLSAQVALEDEGFYLEILRKYKNQYLNGESAEDISGWNR